MRWRIITLAFAVAALLSACVVDTPAVENTQVDTSGATESTTQQPAVPTAAGQPQFQPTSPPAQAPPTPVAIATTAPTATPAPIPTAEVTPLPTEGPASEFTPSLVQPGEIAIPVAGRTSFVLDEARPILQLGGHSLIYLDDSLLGEVDIFTPVADRDGNLLATYDDVIAFLKTDSTFISVNELEPVTIANARTRIFDGTPVLKPDSAERAFATSTDGISNDQLGWFPPARVRLWVIDAPGQPIIVSAESLQDPGQFVEAEALAASILTTIEFG